MKKAMQATVALLLVVLMLGFFLIEFHFAGESVKDCVLLWNSQEGYLFIGWGRSGYHFTAFEYLFSHISAYFGVARPVDDNRFSTIVVRILPTGIERYVTARYEGEQGFISYVPNGKTIFAYDGGATPWKWSGTRFEKANPEEQLRAIPGENLPLSKRDYTDVEGWSSRHLLINGFSRCEIELQGKPITLLATANNLAADKRETSLDLQISGGAPQSILRTKSWFHLVSRSEYERIFEGTQRQTK